MAAATARGGRKVAAAALAAVGLGYGAFAASQLAEVRALERAHEDLETAVRRGAPAARGFRGGAAARSARRCVPRTDAPHRRRRRSRLPVHALEARAALGQPAAQRAPRSTDHCARTVSPRPPAAPQMQPRRPAPSSPKQTPLNTNPLIPLPQVFVSQGKARRAESDAQEAAALSAALRRQADLDETAAAELSAQLDAARQQVRFPVFPQRACRKCWTVFTLCHSNTTIVLAPC